MISPANAKAFLIECNYQEHSDEYRAALAELTGVELVGSGSGSCNGSGRGRGGGGEEKEEWQSPRGKQNRRKTPEVKAQVNAASDNTMPNTLLQHAMLLPTCHTTPVR